MKEITVEELEVWKTSSKHFLLLDVREEWEHAHFNIGGTLIPLSELLRRKDEIPPSLPVVIYCEKGIRSVIAIQRLEMLGLDNLYNLKGGMKAWKEMD